MILVPFQNVIDFYCIYYGFKVKILFWYFCGPLDIVLLSPLQIINISKSHSIYELQKSFPKQCGMTSTSYLSFDNTYIINIYGINIVGK